MAANNTHGVAQSLQVRQLALRATNFARDNPDRRNGHGYVAPFGERGDLTDNLHNVLQLNLFGTSGVRRVNGAVCRHRS